MGTVRKSAKVTGTLIVIAVAAIFMYYWYSVSDSDYFDMVKAFMHTKAEIGGVHVFFINLAFWISVVVSVVNAALNDKYGFNIVSAFWALLLFMCGLALLFIPGNVYTNIHQFWLICYILITIVMWLSARQTTKFCLENSNFSVLLQDPEAEPKLNVSRIDFIVAALLSLISYILLVLLVIGTLIFGIRNRELIAGMDDITPVVSSVRQMNQDDDLLKTSLAGIWQGDAGSRLTLREDLTCGYVDGGGSTGDGTWDVIDGYLIFQTDALSYELYGELVDGYLTTSVLIKADSSFWIEETFTKE